MRTACTKKTFKATIVLLGLSLLVAWDPASAQPVDVPPTWGGDIWSRPRLTGDWGGLRDELGKKGVVLDVDLLYTPLDVVGGGISTGSAAWGNLDYTLNVDTQKLGLWPGGFFNFSATTGFGSDLSGKSNAIVPVNTSTLIPGPNDRTTALMNATFMQFLSEQFGLVAGKFNTLGASSEQEFYGDYHTQFLNMAFDFPVILEQVPVSAFGGGIIGLPTKDIVLSVIALDPNGTPTSNDLAHAFSNGVLVTGSGQMTIRPFGLVGHQILGFSWRNEEVFSLQQEPSNLAALLIEGQFPRLGDAGQVLAEILAHFFPNLPPGEPPNRLNSSWSAYYSFDQYFWQPAGDPKRGIGAFFSAGVTDGNPNPIKYALMGGIGGKGVVPGRPDDSFGVGVAQTHFSDEFVPFLRQHLNLGLDNENTLEMYYNFAVTKWLAVSADLQIIDPALKKALSPSGPGLTNVSTTTVVGIRIRARF